MMRTGKKNIADLEAWMSIQQDKLYADFHAQIVVIQNRCEHVFDNWQHRWHDSYAGGYTMYERSCDLCDLRQSSESLPEGLDYMPKETHDNRIEIY